MKDIVVKPLAKSPMRWGIAELDELTQSLPDHGSLLIVAAESETYDAIWNLISSTVLRGLIDDGFEVRVLEGHKKSLLEVEERIFQDGTDLLLVNCSDSRSLNEVCDLLVRIPSGFVLLARKVPADWQDAADLMLVFQSDAVQVRTVNRLNDRSIPFDGGLIKLLAKEDSRTKFLPKPQNPRAVEPQIHIDPEAEGKQRVERDAQKDFESSSSSSASSPTSVLSSSLGPMHLQQPAANARLALIGISGELESLLRKHLDLYSIACEAFEVSQVRRRGESPAENFDWVVLSGSMSDPNLCKFIETNAPLTRMILLATKRMRSSDCARAYQLGIKLVLSVDSEIEERFAAICAQLLPLKKEILDPFQEVDLEYARLSSRFKKRLYWSAEETTQATAHFFPMLSNQMRRATLAGQAVGALVIELPNDIPQASVFQSLQLLVQRSVVGAMLQLLRERDLSFVVGNKLIILSHHMNSFTARAILKRLCAVLRDLGIEQMPQGKIMRAQMPDQETAPEEAKRFLRKIFATFEK